MASEQLESAAAGSRIWRILTLSRVASITQNRKVAVQSQRRNGDGEACFGGNGPGDRLLGESKSSCRGDSIDCELENDLIK